jgi:hypothetical protein
MSSHAPRLWVSRLIAAVMCLIAAAAVAITVPRVVALRRGPAPLPIAPGLAASSDHQLAELLPAASSFPADWTPKKTYDSPDVFGYPGYHNAGADDGYEPVACYEVAYGARIGAFQAATVDEHDPADPGYLSDRSDIRLSIGREFNPSVFDEMRTLATQCPHFHARFPGFDFTVRILEDTRPADGPQRFRYRVTITYGHDPVNTIGSDDYAYARISGLIVSGTATDGHQRLLDQLFGDTLRRADAAHTPQ